MAAYFVDNAGSNSNTGLTGHPWQTPAKVSSFSASPGFAAGDSISFTAGQTFTGTITIVNSGTAGNYIYIGTPGRSAATPLKVAQSNPARLNCANTDGIQLNDCSYVWVDNIDVHGSGVSRVDGSTSNTGIGIHGHSTQTTTILGANWVTACSVTDCFDGLCFETDYLAGTRFGWNGLTFWGCHTYWNQRQGIGLVHLNVYGDGTATENTNVYIGYCESDHQPGNLAAMQCGTGIFVRSCTNAVVEYCVVHDINSFGNQPGVAGTAGFNNVVSDTVTFQYCEVYNVFTAPATGSGGTLHADGHGFNPDLGNTNTVIQYCYVHDNDSSACFSQDCTMRFNIFANNNKVNPTFTQAGTVTSTLAFNNKNGSGGTTCTAYANTMYCPNSDVVGTVDATGTSSQLYLANNIFVSKAGNKCIDSFNLLLALGNLYYAIGGGTVTIVVRNGSHTYTTLAGFRTLGDLYENHSGINYGIIGDPLLKTPTTAPDSGTLPNANVSTITYFDLLRTSPAVNLGIAYSILSLTPGLLDFKGNSNVNEGNYNTGAIEGTYVHTPSPIPPHTNII